MLRNRKELPWKLGDGQSQGCPVKKNNFVRKVAVIHHGE